MRKYLCKDYLLVFKLKLKKHSSQAKNFMDFLDPRRKRAHNIRLIIGYILVAIAIGLGTIILVYSAYGYGVNTKTGDVVQNGLLFADSKPGGADIYLNKKSVHQSTSARLVLPSGDYDILLKKNGYRDWERKFTLDEHMISRFVYPFLFPTKPVTAALKSYSSLPPLFTETPDRHWLLVQIPPTALKPASFDEFNTGDLTKPAVPLDIPASILTNPTLPGSVFTKVEWATDNNHLLLQHNFQGGSEFIVLDRNDPTKSFNVDKLFSLSPSQVALHNKKIDQLYIYQQDNGTLSLGDTSRGTVAAPILRHVVAFKPYGNNSINYVTDTNMPANKVQARIWNNGRSYPLYSFTAGDKYMVDTASYGDHTYYVDGSSSSERINLYKDPISDIQNPSVGKAIPMLALQTSGANKVSFSDNARFIALEGGQNFAIYDLETDSHFQYTLQVPLAKPLEWMDGHRLIGEAGSSVFVMDYDAINQQSLVPTATSDGAFFSRDFNQMFTLSPVSSSPLVNLERVDMRAGTDLPKTP
jgi:hypothetical protein